VIAHLEDSASRTLAAAKPQRLAEQDLLSREPQSLAEQDWLYESQKPKKKNRGETQNEIGI